MTAQFSFLGLLFAMLWAVTARAVEPLPREFLLDRTFPGTQFAEEFLAAWEGDCGPLIAEIQPDAQPIGNLSDSWHHAMAAVQMYDRGLCVPFQPEKGTEILKKYVEHTVYRAALDLGWRAWHGFGMEKDADAARSYFALGLVGSPFRYSRLTRTAERSPLGRALPDASRALAAEIEARIGTKAGLISFAVELARGGVSLGDEVSTPPMPSAALSIFRLERLRGDFDAKLHYVELAYKGIFGPRYVDEWRYNLSQGVECGHIPTLEFLADAYEEAANEEEDMAFYAMDLLWRLVDLGIDQRSRIANIVAMYESVPHYLAEERERVGLWAMKGTNCPS